MNILSILFKAKLRLCSIFANAENIMSSQHSCSLIYELKENGGKATSQ